MTFINKVMTIKRVPVRPERPYFFNDNNLTSLTDLWKASGRGKDQQPFEWLRQEETENFLKTFKKNFKTGSDPVLETKRGRYGGTYGHWQIALAYTQYWIVTSSNT